LREYLRDLDQEFMELVDSASGDITLQSRAHKIVSQAGMLGLTRMSDCARRVEDACRDGSGCDAAVLQCREATADVELYAIPAATAAADDEPTPGS
jgi:HPt (histidine-containing phosphotransfer) domain-containing protein